MRNVKRAVAFMMILTLMATSAALAAPAPAKTLNGTWDAKMNATVAGVKIKSARLVFKDGRVRLSTLGKSTVGTYVMKDNNKVTVAFPANTLGVPNQQTLSYSIKNGKMTLQGKILGKTMKQAFTRQTPKVTKVSANKVKVGKTSTIKVKVNSPTDFITLTNSKGEPIKIQKMTRKSNTFTVTAKFTAKKNTIYVRAGFYDVDGKISGQSKLSSQKKFVVQCK